MHSVDQSQSFFHAAFPDGILDGISDIDDRVSVLRVHPEILGMRLHLIVFID